MSAMMLVEYKAMYLPPDVVDDPCLYILEAIIVSQDFYYGSSTETVPCHSDLVNVEPILPLLPVDTL